MSTRSRARGDFRRSRFSDGRGRRCAAGTDESRRSCGCGEVALLTSAGIIEGLHRRLDGPLTEEVKRQLIETLVDGILVETIGERDELESRVTVTNRFDTPDTSIDPCSPRGIRVLQTLALPLGYAAPKKLWGGDLYLTCVRPRNESALDLQLDRSCCVSGGSSPSHA